MKHYWGVDLGGTKIEGVVLEVPDPASGEFTVLARTRVPTEQTGGYETITGNIARLIELLKEETSLSPSIVGFGTPGSIDPVSRKLRNSNTQCLNGKPLLDDLERVLECPVRIANDANCFALAEARLGAGKGASTVFGVIMGTGVGGGVVINGQALAGANGIAGEWGHNVLDPDGPDCYCGKSGCVETILSGPALERYYEGLSGVALTLPEIAQQSDTDEYAAATMSRLTDYFGRALAYVMNILDPDVIVLGGGVSNVELLYSEGIQKVVKDVFHDTPKMNVVRNELGDSAGVFGAAMLTFDPLVTG